MNSILKMLSAAVLLATFFYSGASATDHRVLMKNVGSNGEPMQYEPAFLRLAAGDSVTFVPEDAGHNAQMIEGMEPQGTEWWGGAIDKELTVTFGVAGLHPYKCGPHLEMGMVGLIQVDDVITKINAAELNKLPAKARGRLKALLAKAGAPISN